MLVGAAVLSGGTANGVLFLNANKAVTSGTALTFDGTKLTVSATSGETALITNTGASSYLSIKGNTSATTIWTGIGTDTGEAWLGAISDHPLSFRQNNTKRMELTAAGLDIKTKLAVGYSDFTNIPANGAAFLGSVGIGTNSPGYLLDVVSATINPSVRVRSNGGIVGNYSELILQSFNNFSGIGQAFIRGVSTASGNSNTSLTFGVNESGFGAPYEAMRILHNGNVGIGDTNPLALLSVGPKSLSDVNIPIQISTQAASGIRYIGVNKNGTYGALFGYDNSSFNGATIRNVVATGESGDGISFVVNNTSEIVRITGGGAVGIGNTNPQARLQVEELGIDTTATTLGIGTGATAVYSVGTTLFRTMELMIQITQGSNYHAVKLFVLHNGTDVWFNQTNVLHTAAELGTFSMDISAGNVRAIYTPTSTAVASTVKVAATMIAV